MSGNTPLVSVGMPVFNGERYIRQALDSLLAQDYENFELIISDNASSDQTGEICQAYAARDKRIRYYKNEANFGATKNFIRVLDLASGQYFMWAAHDDLWDPRFMSACVSALERNPSAILCTTSATFIDKEGKMVDKYDEDIDTVGLDTLSRLGKVLRGVASNTSFYGISRTKTTRQIRLPNHYGGDHVFMAEMSLYGEFIRLPQYYFYCRIGGTGYSIEKVMRSLGIRSPFVRYLPNLSFFIDFLRAAASWEMLGPMDRLRATRLVIKRFASHPYRERIINDVRNPIYNQVRHAVKRAIRGASL